MAEALSRPDVPEGIVLVSASPRRKAILGRLGIPFTVESVSISEELVQGVEAVEQAVALARAKLEAYLGRHREPPDLKSWAFAADTVIEMDGRVIGKPRTRSGASGLLRAYSGRSHTVITGLALFNPISGAIVSDSASTEVHFARLSAGEIEWYLDTGEWMDAAGGYRIQDRGEILVEAVHGSYSNVVGLPIRTFCGMLHSQQHPYFRERRD